MSSKYLRTFVGFSSDFWVFFPKPSSKVRTIMKYQFCTHFENNIFFIKSSKGEQTLALRVLQIFALKKFYYYCAIIFMQMVISEIVLSLLLRL